MRETDWRSDPEKRLIDRRCRCGRLAAETGEGCEWHPSVSAEYARDLQTALRMALDGPQIDPGPLSP